MRGLYGAGSRCLQGNEINGGHHVSMIGVRERGLEELPRPVENLRVVNSSYRSLPTSANRRMVAASSAVGREKNTIHMLTEADISAPRRVLAEHLAKTGERLSLTAYVVACLARTLEDFPEFNAFRRGRRTVILEDVTISVLVEREMGGESVPEPMGVQHAQRKSYREIHEEIRQVQARQDERMGAVTGTSWVRLVPKVLMRSFMRLASQSISMQRRFGVVAVTAVGMFASGSLWLLPLTSATVTVAVGGIAPRPVLVEGRLEEREHLCLTLSFNHDLIDGAPAARFVSRLNELLASARVLQELSASSPAHTD